MFSAKMRVLSCNLSSDSISDLREHWGVKPFKKSPESWSLVCFSCISRYPGSLKSVVVPCSGYSCLMLFSAFITNLVLKLKTLKNADLDLLTINIRYLCDYWSFIFDVSLFVKMFIIVYWRSKHRQHLIAFNRVFMAAKMYFRIWTKIRWNFLNLHK